MVLKSKHIKNKIMNNNLTVLKYGTSTEPVFEDLSLFNMMKNIKERSEMIEKTNNENLHWFLTTDNSEQYSGSSIKKIRQCETPVKEKEVKRVY